MKRVVLAAVLWTLVPAAAGAQTAAQRPLDALIWASIEAQPSEETVRFFLQRFPRSQQRANAEQMLSSLAPAPVRPNAITIAPPDSTPATVPPIVPPVTPRVPQTRPPAPPQDRTATVTPPTETPRAPTAPIVPSTRPSTVTTPPTRRAAPPPPTQPRTRQARPANPPAANPPAARRPSGGGNCFTFNGRRFCE